MLKPDIYGLVLQDRPPETDPLITIISLLPMQMKAVLFGTEFCHN
jgi:hypothetical protein